MSRPFGCYQILSNIGLIFWVTTFFPFTGILRSDTTLKTKPFQSTSDIPVVEKADQDRKTGLNVQPIFLKQFCNGYWCIQSQKKFLNCRLTKIVSTYCSQVMSCYGPIGPIKCTFVTTIKVHNNFVISFVLFHSRWTKTQYSELRKIKRPSILDA